MSLPMRATQTGEQFPYIIQDGHHRMLMALPPRPGGSGLPQWADAGKPQLSQSDWLPFDRTDKRIKILDQDGHGCHDDQTEVLTDRGWCLWSQYDGKDRLGTMDRTTRKLVFQVPVEQQIYDYDGPLYKSRADSLDFALTPSHRMWGRQYNDDNHAFETGQDFRKIRDIKHVVMPYLDWGVKDVPDDAVAGRSEFNFNSSFMLDREHLREEPYRGKVYCATVPNGTLVTRRNQHVLISGNSCVGHGACTSFTFAYLKSGGQRNDFSPCFVYGLGNGGRDAGMVVSDAMKILMDVGMALDAEVPEGMIWKRDFPAQAFETAKRFKIVEAYSCPTFDDLGTAQQLGYDLAYGIQVGGGFTSLDGEGVPGVGGGGGHCLAAANAMKKSSRWGWLIKTQNSWGSRYGEGGYCWLSKAHFEYGGYLDAYAIRSVSVDPQADQPHVRAQ